MMRSQTYSKRRLIEVPTNMSPTDSLDSNRGQRALRAERDLLENTLNGAVRSLAGLVQLSGPALTARSEAIKAIVAHIATRSEVAERWQYDLAAMLCLIGCISLPVEVFERAYAGETMSAVQADNAKRASSDKPKQERIL
jgi:hypothetical protein